MKLNPDTMILFKRNVLSKNTVILLLVAMISVLMFYIGGMKYSEKINEDYSYTSEADSTQEISTQDKYSGLYININTDDISELMQLPGIGKTKAQLILNYRKENGDFHFIEEIKNIRARLDIEE